MIKSIAVIILMLLFSSCKKGLDNRWSLLYSEFSNSNSKLNDGSLIDNSNEPIYTFDTISGSRTIYWEKHNYTSMSGAITQSKEILIELPELNNGESISYANEEIFLNLKASIQHTDHGTTTYYKANLGVFNISKLNGEFLLDFDVFFGDDYQMISGGEY
jgi:hypothetical protein